MKQTLLAARDVDLVCEATRGLWEDQRGQHLFITGGTGFFGRWLLETFIAANDRFALNARATVLTRNPARFAEACPHLAQHPAVALIAGDMQSFAYPAGEFSMVIHAAADVSAARGVANAGQSGLLATTFDGTRRVLDFARSHGTRRFLMVSSGAVYGPQPTSLTHLPENYSGAPDTCQPSSAYGEGKRASEALCAAYSGHNGLDCLIARPFAFVGPHLELDQGFAIGDFIRSAMASEPILIRGDGTPLRSYLYAADLAVWLWTILFRGVPMRPYNVGSSEAISVRALAEEVAAILSPGLPIHVAQTSRSDAPLLQYVPDVLRCAQELKLVQTVTLREAIQRTAEWHGWQSATSLSHQEFSIEAH
jgi:nucleoside-diphosphate-sugar epimerase